MCDEFLIWQEVYALLGQQHIVHLAVCLTQRELALSQLLLTALGVHHYVRHSIIVLLYLLVLKS
jgi:hypothetical protein